MCALAFQREANSALGQRMFVFYDFFFIFRLSIWRAPIGTGTRTKHCVFIPPSRLLDSYANFTIFNGNIDYRCSTLLRTKRKKNQRIINALYLYRHLQSGTSTTIQLMCQFFRSIFNGIYCCSFFDVQMFYFNIFALFSILFTRFRFQSVAFCLLLACTMCLHIHNMIHRYSFIFKKYMTKLLLELTVFVVVLCNRYKYLPLMIWKLHKSVAFFFSF